MDKKIKDEMLEKVELKSAREPRASLERKYLPVVSSILRSKVISVPEAIYKASGIRILGTRIKSLLFTTDLAIIKNTNANCIMAVYPFSPQLSITQSILDAAHVPVFVGVGGGITSGKRTINIALQAELLGAYGVVVNSPMDIEVIKEMKSILDIPVVATVVSASENILEKIDAGVGILNVAGGSKTPQLVREIRALVGPGFPIMATGGNSSQSIEDTIEAGANAITYTPPSTSELFAEIMDSYRIQREKEARERLENSEK